MKLRVAQPEQGEFVRRFGGTSITMSAPEVPAALDRGVVEGIFTAGVGAVLWKDLLNGYLLVVNVNNSYFIANTDAYKKLSPDLQGKLRKVAEDTARWNQDTMKREEAGVAADPVRRRLYADQGEAGGGHSRRQCREALLGRVGEDARWTWSMPWPRSAPRSIADAEPGPAMIPTEAGAARRRPASAACALPEGPVEWTCKLASEAALVVMLVLVAVDIVTRWVFNFSFEVSDEVGGYMLVVICFVSLSACHVNGSFHEVEFVQARLTARGRSISH